MIVESQSDIIDAINKGYPVELKSRRAYNSARLFLLDYCEYLSENKQWDTFHKAASCLETLDSVWAPPGGWNPPDTALGVNIEK